MNPNELANQENSQNWQQRLAEDAYEDQRHFNRSINDAQIQFEKEVAVCNAKKKLSSEYQMQQREHKYWFKIYAEEVKKNNYDAISITAEGKITATVQNLYDNATPRVITNMNNPTIVRLIHLEQQEEIAYQLNARLENADVSIYLDSENIGSPSYLLRKLTAHGILFFANTLSHQKTYAQILICFLLTQELKIDYVPSKPGWAYFPDDNFYFTEEEELTWQKIKKLTK